MTKQQIEYLTLYEAGYSISEIARLKRRSRTTVSRVLKRAKGKKCPFSDDCKTCPLEDCAIDAHYAVLLNGNYAKNRMKKKIF